MGQESKEIPGLISISEQPGTNGGMTLIFEVEDDKVDQFFAAFGLQPGDQEGFQRAVIESLEMMMTRMQDRYDEELLP